MKIILIRWLVFLALVIRTSCQPENCEDGAVRLVDGMYRNEGRVELCIQNKWGTVCDDHWSREDAIVVCSQLGLPDARALPVLRAFFGAGSGMIHLDNILCSGTESNLLECPHNGIGINNCVHAEDAGVICQKHCDNQTHADNTDNHTQLITPSTVISTIVQTITESTTLVSTITTCGNPQRLSEVATISGLGAFSGVLLLVIVGVATGWICTCVLNTRKRSENGGAHINGSASLLRNSSNDHIYLGSSSASCLVLDEVTSTQHTTTGGTTYELLNSSSNSLATNDEDNTYDVIPPQDEQETHSQNTASPSVNIRNKTTSVTNNGGLRSSLNSIQGMPNGTTRSRPYQVQYRGSKKIQTDRTTPNNSIIDEDKKDWKLARVYIRDTVRIKSILDDDDPANHSYHVLECRTDPNIATDSQQQERKGSKQIDTQHFDEMHKDIPPVPYEIPLKRINVQSVDDEDYCQIED